MSIVSAGPASVAGGGVAPGGPLRATFSLDIGYLNVMRCADVLKEDWELLE